jgi:transcription initiation factor TFIIH subunit 1
VRKSGNEHEQRKKDDIFDAYLEDPDWNAEPRREAAGEGAVGRVIDLYATQEDHGDVSGVRGIVGELMGSRIRSAMSRCRQGGSGARCR